MDNNVYIEGRIIPGQSKNPYKKRVEARVNKCHNGLRTIVLNMYNTTNNDSMVDNRICCN